MPTKEDSNLISEEDYKKFSFLPKIEEYVSADISRRSTASAKSSDLNGDESQETAKKMDPISLQLGPAMEYPHVSRISSEDHKWLIIEYKKLLSEQTDILCPAKAKRLQELKSQVLEEQEEFQQFVFHHARFNFHLYNFINPEVLTSVKNIFQSQKENLVKKYPQYYALQQTVGLVVGAAYPSDPVMKFEKMLLQRGEVPRLVIPDSKSLSTMNLTKTYTSLSLGSEFQSKYEDPIAVTLAKAHSAHFVMSSGAFTTLVQIQQSDFDQQWDIPIIVHDNKEERNDTSKIPPKTVFLEKPLPKLSPNPKEVNDIYFKRALTETCCKLHKRSYSLSESMSLSGISDKDGINHQEANSEHSSSVKRLKIEKSCGNDRVQTEMKEFSNDQTGSGGENLFHEKNVSASSTIDLQNKLPTGISSGVNENTVYNLWTFGKFRVLICCSLEGYKETSQEPRRYEYFTILPKLEYQPTFGYERLTATETAQMWAHAYIRPNTKILCGRVNRYNSVIMRLDEMEIGDILNFGDGFNPAHAMKLVYKILESLINLPRGEYLLTHSSGDIHSCLYRHVDVDGPSSSQEKHSKLDHFNRYKNNEIMIRSYKENAIPFSRIDTNLFLPCNIEKNRFAATFPAVPSHELEKMRKNSRNISKGPNKGKKRKKGKMKKKTTSNTELVLPSEVKTDNLPGVRTEQNACADQHAIRNFEGAPSAIGHEDQSLLPQKRMSRRAKRWADKVLQKVNLGDMDLPKEEEPDFLEETRQRAAVSYTDLDDF